MSPVSKSKFFRLKSMALQLSIIYPWHFNPVDNPKPDCPWKNKWHSALSVDDSIKHYSLGYNISGAASIACGPRGEWAEAVPACTRNQCTPTDIVGGIVTSTGPYYMNNKITYQCKPAFYMVSLCCVLGMWPWPIRVSGSYDQRSMIRACSSDSTTNKLYCWRLKLS